MNLRAFIAFLFIVSLVATPLINAQTDSVIGQFTVSSAESFAGSISGDGRLVVFESRGNVATENPRNTDGNTEIFLWDYAQRRIFQITDTKSVLKNTFGTTAQANILVDIVNKRPVISQNGQWIAFASNATRSIITTDDGSNPGSFNGNFYNRPGPLPDPSPSGGQCPVQTPTPTPTATPTPSPTPTGTPSATPTPTSTPFVNDLQCDANMEVWLYQIPAYAAADLTTGDTVALTNLSGGPFTRLTDTAPSRFPQDGTALRAPFVADDNHDASIDDDGSTVAFVSTRALDAIETAAGDLGNDEIFVYANGVLNRVTRTPRGTVQNPIYSKNPTISGDGSRVAFASTGDDPIDDPNSATNFNTGSNPADSRNEEIFFADLVNSLPTGGRQVTTTTPTTAGATVNLLEYGKRMSRDGRFIAFDSFADLAGENSGTNYTSFATYIYDASPAAAASPFKRVGARSDADSQATGGDVARYPGFTDYPAGCSGAACVPGTLVLETRMNLIANGTVATTNADGLNTETTRPVQFYTVPLTGALAGTPTFSRITKFPISSTFLAQSQPLPSDTSQRFAFNLGLTELGGGNSDLLTEVFYLYVPLVTGTTTTSNSLAFVTGASLLPITPTASPNPSPTATPSPTPTPTPAPTPTGSPSPTPTPVTPASVTGISPGMLARLTFTEPLAVTPRTATGNLDQSFSLPITLSGLTLTINGYAAGLKSVDPNYIEFVAPPGFGSAATGTNYPVVVNNNGTVIKGFVTFVPARPDIFSSVIGPGGRAQARNVTNRVHTTEPFTVTTVRVRGGRRVPTLLRLRLTGVQGATPANFSIRIGDQTITGTAIKTGGVLVEPGVYTVDFELPAGLNGDGDQPIVVTIVAGSATFSSRLDDTAPRIRIL